jgi:cytochrome c oxidase subunit IV
MLSGERTVFLFVYLACLVLLAATIGVAHLRLGTLNPILNLSIAAAKSFLIVWFFMHVREGSRLVRLAAFAGLFWLIILFGLSLTDWLTRPPGWQI